MAIFDDILGVKHVRFGRIHGRTIKIPAGHVTVPHSEDLLVNN
jgi:hypothetical protein